MDTQKDLHEPQAKLLNAEKRLYRVGKTTAGLLVAIAALRGAAEAHEKITGSSVGADQLPEIEKMANQLAGLQVALADKIDTLHAQAEFAAAKAGASYIDILNASGGDKDAMGDMLRRMFGG